MKTDKGAGSGILRKVGDVVFFAAIALIGVPITFYLSIWPFIAAYNLIFDRGSDSSTPRSAYESQQMIDSLKAEYAHLDSELKGAFSKMKPINQEISRLIFAMRTIRIQMDSLSAQQNRELR